MGIAMQMVIILDLEMGLSKSEANKAGEGAAPEEEEDVFFW